MSDVRANVKSSRWKLMMAFISVSVQYIILKNIRWILTRGPKEGVLIYFINQSKSWGLSGDQFIFLSHSPHSLTHRGDRQGDKYSLSVYQCLTQPESSPIKKMKVGKVKLKMYISNIRYWIVQSELQTECSTKNGAQIIFI